jgi:hypothetical protein
MLVILEGVKSVLSLRAVIAIIICVKNAEILRLIVVVMVNVIVVEEMSIVVQKGGLVANVKNGIAIIFDKMIILVRNVVLNQSLNLKRKMMKRKQSLTK